MVIGSFERGVFVYDMNTQEIIRPDADLSDVNIARISPLNETELLIATEGMGVYKVNVNTCELEDYIIANYQSYNEMNGNNINDVFVDEEKRIWLANYPTGITVIDNRYENYHWMKHAMGNAQSLINDQVQAVIEDHEGDLWFGTSNGISLYNSKTGQWHSFLSSFNHQLKDKNHIFITLCEVAPGIIWAGGYTSGIYKINKETLSVEYFSPYLLSHVNMRPDKYIRDIVKDSRGHIWSGGYYNLKCFDLETNSARLYPGLNSITSIVEKDKDNMWIGTAAGLYLLNRNTGEYQYIEMEIGITYINTLYQADNGLLYIGTNGMGVFIYNPQDKTFEHYFSDNSALVSNRIFTILPEVDGRIMMSTENGITCFHTKEKIFRNWTRGEGLLPAYFNAAAGTVRKNKNFVFGSTDGAIELPMNVKFPDYKFSRLVFSDFHLSYQPVYPGVKDSPLQKSIDETDVLELAYDENTFSFEVSTINYDSPGNALYSWKLEGFYEKWTQPGANNLIRFTNLPPGRYILHVRAISREEHDIVFQERAMKIIITQPFWSSWWAILCYILLVIGGFYFVLRVINLRKQKNISDEKTQFFINTAHDIRTPLTLIKAPLEELLEEETLTDNGITRTNIALRNVEDDPNLRRILVVEDNDELRSYLVSSLSSIYNVQACANGKEALIIIKEYWPELVLSDIMMPEMRGDELCVAIKSDIEISHIPVLLLTALGEENNILDGLSIGADEYLIKPFSVKILRANIANLLANRELLRMRYANLDIEAKSMVPSANGTNSLDWKFISNVKKIVDENINNPEFSVNVLCESSGMSRTSFYCKLKALTGQSPTEFIRGMRLKRATELLKEGEYAINEISDMVGFSETKYFREVFKKYYKMSPSRYAKEGGNPSAELEDDEED